MINSGLIYLASPYTHEDETIKAVRYEEVCRATATLIKEGCLIFSPIVHSHPLVHYDVPSSWDFWKDYDSKFIMVCDELWVLKLDGWIESMGVQNEIKIAMARGKRIRFVEPIAPYRRDSV